ncbi:polysaccharide deacetylase family protein [Planomonospora sp. ID91781]|uniref:polysaccharide deacetylase family protein n=1 Tax=Planomonospora sp. ID91781 TaxID=2738135 RepID=UPI002107D817|nr:polysaccharide deacetylase family protein [Planomonospora sp. ID91781]
MRFTGESTKSTARRRRPVRAGTRWDSARLLVAAVLTAVCAAGQGTGSAAAGTAGAAPTAPPVPTARPSSPGSASPVPGTPPPPAAPAQEPAVPTQEPAVPAQEPAAPAVPAQKPAVQTSAAQAPADCRRIKCVALTFDDGPGRYTGTLLRHLAAYRARATFYVVGRNVAENPGVVRRAVEAGHEIGNHTWSHHDLTRLPAAAIRADLARTDRAVERAAGVTPETVRPPYGAHNTAVRRQTKRPVVLWSVDTEDWRHRDSSAVARRAIKGTAPGAVILFHDIHPTTVKAIPKVLKSLSARGYRFVTVSELFGGKPPRLAYGGRRDAPGSRR